MKTHARRIATGGIIAPLALLLATVIANEGQTLLGLHLDQTALAVYLVPFLLGAAHVLNGLFKVEASAIGKDLGAMLKDLDLGALFGPTPDPLASAEQPKAIAEPPPPTQPPSSAVEGPPPRRVLDRPEA